MAALAPRMKLEYDTRKFTTHDEWLNYLNTSRRQDGGPAKFTKYIGDTRKFISIMSDFFLGTGNYVNAEDQFLRGVSLMVDDPFNMSGRLRTWTEVKALALGHCYTDDDFHFYYCLGKQRTFSQKFPNWKEIMKIETSSKSMLEDVS